MSVSRIVWGVFDVKASSMYILYIYMCACPSVCVCIFYEACLSDAFVNVNLCNFLKKENKLSLF